MRELTMRQMSEINGREGFFEGFFEGFLCGAGVIATIAIWSSPEPILRWTVLSTTIGVCGLAFFG